MIFKTLTTIASFVVVAAIIGSCITVYLSISRTTVKIGFWNNDETFVYSKLIETFDKITTGQLTYKNITYSTLSLSTSSSLSSFDSYDDSIYVTDTLGYILTFDKNWKETTAPYAVMSLVFIKQINSELYTSEISSISRRSTNGFTVTGTESVMNPFYRFRAIYYDQSTYRLVLATTEGVVFRDLQLNLISTVNSTGGEPYSVYGYDGKYYVGVKTESTATTTTVTTTTATSTTSTTTAVSTTTTTAAITRSSSIVTLEDNVVLNTFQMTDRCIDSTIIQLLFDPQGFMAITCDVEKTIYIYHHSGVYTGRSLTFPTTPKYINYDSNGNFVVLEEQRIRLYS